MTTTHRAGLGRVGVIPLAFGSIAGSGILSLPSAVYAEAGTASLLAWLLAAAMCLPMLVMFRDAMRLSGDGDAVEMLVGRGLAPWVGAAMPLLFLCVVIVGLPAGCLVAGRYVEQGLGLTGAAPFVAGGLLVVALVTSLLGGRVGKGVQLAGSMLLVLTGVLLVVSSLGAGAHPASGFASSAEFGKVMPGVLLAFWAFVGFENLTFLGRELRDPARDFLTVCISALLVYGGFAIALTLAIAVVVGQNDVDPVTGLLQLAANPAMRGAVALVALAAMLINAAAWVRGVQNLIVTAAGRKQLPSVLGSTRAGIGVLAVAFSAAGGVLLARPDLLVGALAASSAVFVLIYLACTVSYLRYFGVSAKSAFSVLLVPVMVVALVESGARSVYGVAAAGACLAWSFSRRGASRAA